ncbi:mitochondrial protein translocase family [Plasmopara halstedii]|uniref:GrpE protein homolog n=1 Tax=Plasmopara halstedii TaxID=4781 RepID=A0A0P1B1X3_PLAHL|nr:mitochondrial protein translocase family [Plasmopara halstedii]CEG47998.1 mitochondrial protein translocase family [Plasmopara halstedii]|eukprot:XP_024584367.1 mitochondrial protein translocase family [Plasmopara halstedii]
MLRRIVLSSAIRTSRIQLRHVSQTPAYSADEKPAADTTTESDGEQPLSDMDVLKQQLEQLAAQNKDMNDRLLRALADAENVRRISRVDVNNAREFAISKFAKALLDVSDNLKRAHESVDVEALEPEKQLDAIKMLHEGVAMTETQLQKVFREFNINQVGAVGDKFDPNVHDALFEYEDATKEAGCIGQIMKTGYTLNDRVIRPAQVGVIKASVTQ